jgi:hypothetical protein
MLTVSLHDRTIAVSFQHPTKIIEVGPSGCLGEQRVTVCYIWNFDSEPSIQLLGTGQARCYYRDQFNRATGRKLALTRAMTVAGLDKVDRTLVWRAYHNRIFESSIAVSANRKEQHQ